MWCIGTPQGSNIFMFPWKQENIAPLAWGIQLHHIFYSAWSTYIHGSHLFAANQTCLSPMFGNVRPNIVDTATMITNSSVLLEWEVTNLLPESCSEFVFSISPYIYIVEYELYQGTPLFEEVRIILYVRT